MATHRAIVLVQAIAVGIVLISTIASAEVKPKQDVVYRAFRLAEVRPHVQIYDNYENQNLTSLLSSAVSAKSMFLTRMSSDERPKRASRPQSHAVRWSRRMCRDACKRRVRSGAGPTGL